MEENRSMVLKKLSTILLIFFVLLMITFSTWQLFRGNLEAAFSSLPFLLIVYLFMLKRR
jgi:hypothetical protein